MSSKNYVENGEFYDEICKYLEKLKINPDVQIPDSLGRKIERTVRGFSNLPSFRNYPFKEDMIGSALYYALKYIKNYDVSKKNPHAYISKIAYNAFLQVIDYEKKQMYMKFKSQLNNDSVANVVNSGNHTILHGTTGDFTAIEKFVNDYEGSMEKRKLKKAQNNK